MWTWNASKNDGDLPLLVENLLVESLSPFLPPSFPLSLPPDAEGAYCGSNSCSIKKNMNYIILIVHIRYREVDSIRFDLSSRNNGGLSQGTQAHVVVLEQTRKWQQKQNKPKQRMPLRIPFIYCLAQRCGRPRVLVRSRSKCQTSL